MIINNHVHADQIVEQEIKQAQAIYQLIAEFFITYSFQFVGALIILALGILVANKINQLVLKLCKAKHLDITLSQFIANTMRLVVIVMVSIIALGKIGISVTPFIAAIGAVSLGAGLALQGLLSNYGSGFNIIVTRPFVVGDTIRIQNVTGKVKEVHLAYTMLVDEDEVEISIPNKHIVGEIVHNSHKDTLIEETVGISYDSDPELAISVIKQAMTAVDHVSQQRAPMVGIDKFADSSINIGIRFWAQTNYHIETRFNVNAALYKALKEAGISIPYPQAEIRLLNDSSANV